MRKRRSSAMLLAVFFSMVITAYFGFLPMAVHANTASIQISGENQYKSLRLTPEIYNHANSDLSDIRVKDAKGEAVPYFINTGSQSAHETTEAYPMVLVDSYEKEERFYFDYRLSAERESDMIATSIEVAAEREGFAKVVDIYGSYDGLHWDFVQSDRLYRIDDKSKLSIEFDKPQKFTHYRFELANNLERISFQAVNLVYNAVTVEKSSFIESLVPEYRVEEKDKTTFIYLNGLKNLRLCDITIETDSMFKRMVSAPNVSRKELYNLFLNDTAYMDTTLPFDWHIPQEDSFVITIDNNDDRPIEIKSIIVHYFAGEVVFDGSADEVYTLDFGADPFKDAPVYDIIKYKNEILKGPVDPVQLSAVSYAQAGVKATEQDYRLYYNLAVLGTAVLLGGLIILRLRR